MAERTRGEVERRERGRVDADDVSWGVRALQRAQTELDRVLAQRLGMRALDYTAMTHLMETEEPFGPVELASRLGISSGSGTELADRLERAGHLHRRRAPDDRRRVVLEPDEASVGRMLALLAPLFTQLDAVAADLDDAERAAVARYLAAVAERTRTFAAELAEG